jgi:hypothetical protein
MMPGDQGAKWALSAVVKMPGVVGFAGAASVRVQCYSR